jgi:hypothetical protein
MTEWEHSIPLLETLRYSVRFRTLREHREDLEADARESMATRRNVRAAQTFVPRWLTPN